MVRTQIYLTESQRQALGALAARIGRSQSDLIRDAIDALIAKAGENDRLELLEQARGMWRGRSDLPDPETLRRELDRMNPKPD